MDLLTLRDVEVAAEVGVWGAGAGLGVVDHGAVVVGVPSRRPPGLVSPVAFFLLAIPVIVDARGDHEGDEPAWLLRVGQAVETLVQPVRYRRGRHRRAGQCGV